MQKMLETVDTVRERERERENNTLENGVIIFDAKNLKNINVLYLVDNKKIYKNNKRIDCLEKIKDRVMGNMQFMHKNNICTKLLLNSLSFLCENKYRFECKDKYA